MVEKDNSPTVKRQLLGEILLKRNLISKEQLDKALQIQQKEQGFLGEILTRSGFVEERDIVVALIVQCNLPYIAVDKYDIDRSILQLIPKEVARRYKVIPLDCVGTVLSVVMADPLNLAVKAELQRITNYRIAPFISTKTAIDKALDRWFGEDS